MRRNDSTDWSRSSAAIQRKPSGELSSDHSAGRSASTRLSSRSRSNTPWWSGSPSRCQSIWPVVVPLALLRQLGALEQQLLAGVRPHPAVERPQVGEALPPVARHLAQQRALEVHDLVVAERQHEVLAPRVDQAEREVVVVPRAVHGRLAEVLERVVHPAHVPLLAEAQAAVVDRPRHAAPRRRLLGDGEDAGDVAVQHRVHLPQEVDGLEVLPPAVAVGDPLALLAGVVEVEHRGHGVDPQAVDVHLLQPVAGAGDEEVAHLVAPEVEDVGAPVGMLALAGVGVLVERRAVEAGERPVVLGEVRRDPVDDDADAPPVQVVDQRPEPVGVAVARGRGEVARRPGSPTTGRTGARWAAAARRG